LIKIIFFQYIWQAEIYQNIYICQELFDFCINETVVFYD